MLLSNKIQSVHFIGIGGAGMSAIAKVLLKHGYHVSGSDLEQNSYTTRLAEAGARIFRGHAAANLGSADLAVVSSAVPPDNVERMAAVERGIAVWQRARMLAAIMDTGHSIAIAGAHGKTTTTSMIGLALVRAGLDPTVVVGGELNDFGGNARVGQGALVVAEADESDGSFLLMRPDLAVVTNVEADHLDYWKTFEALLQGYVEFVGRLKPGGKAVVCVDGSGGRETLVRCGRDALTYGLAPTEAEWQARAIEVRPEATRFECFHKGKPLGEVSLAVPGRHNVANALAALAVAAEHGVDFAMTRQVLSEYRGVERRWQLVGAEGGVTVVDDYAHHPTEIAATLAAARSCQGQGGGRIVCIFQPHRYSRTQLLGDQFGPAFSAADLVVVTDIYSAGEKPIAGVSGEAVFSSVRRHCGSEAYYMADKSQIAPFLAGWLQSGDLAVTMGAGDIWRLGRPLLQALRQRAGAPI